MRISRLPGPTLRPFIKTLWAIDPSEPSGVDRERSLPTGSMHVVFRISGAPLRVYDAPDGTTPRTVGHAIVGGARSTFYVRDVSTPVHSVGAQLYPGASQLLFGVPGGELAERHTLLDDLWGAAAVEARDRIAAARSLDDQLAAFETILASRLPKVRGVHPAVVDALDRFSRVTDVGEVVRQSGFSHRRFIQLFREAVGLTPKLFTRIARFQRALGRLGATPRASLAEVAIDSGYSDQSHFNRDFVELAGIVPSRFREIAPASVNHIPFVSPRPGRR